MTVQKLSQILKKKTISVTGNEKQYAPTIEMKMCGIFERVTYRAYGHIIIKETQIFKSVDAKTVKDLIAKWDAECLGLKKRETLDLE